MGKISAAFVGTALSIFGSSSSYSQEVCAALLAQGIRDTSSTQISESRYNELKSNVCNTNYDSYSKAAQHAMNGGFDLPGIFGISFGDANANSEYGTKWSNLCKSDYGLAMSDSQLKTYFSTANRSVLNSFDNCVNVASERFIRYIEPQSDGRTFAIVFDNRRQGNPSFEIVKISLTDSSTGAVLDVKKTCDFDHDFPWKTDPLNAVSIVCRKPPGDVVVVAGTTTAGNIDPVTVPAVPDAPPTLDDRVAKLEGIAQSLQASVGALKSQETEDAQQLGGKIAQMGTTGPNVLQGGTFNSGTAICPPGSFMVGVRQQIDSGGPHGITSWLGYVCKSVQ